MAPEQLWQALQDIRTQAIQSLDRVAALLASNVQLAYALAEALAVFGVLDKNAPRLVVQARQAQAQAYQQSFAQMPPQPQAGMQLMGPVLMMQPQPQPLQQQQQQQEGVPTAQEAENMEAMIEQLKHLTHEQIMALPPDTRDTVLQLLQ